MKLSPNQKHDLVMAVMSAEGFREHEYVHADSLRPKCVIGQLCHLRGVEGADILTTTQGKYIRNLTEKVKDLRISDYPLQLLIQLQSIWDGEGPARNSTDARMNMLTAIEVYS